MTDKELIKQEIERIEQILDDFNKTHNNTIDNGIVSANKSICKHIKSFINSLPEEPASEDLEEEIDRFEDWINNFNQSDYPTSYTVRDIARHFAEWQKQQMMKDAVDAFVNTYENTDDSNYVEFVTEQSPYKFKETEKCKIIIVKEE